MLFDKLLKKRKYNNDNLLTDLDGNPFIFYRGGSIDYMSNRHFFTNCVHQAISYGEHLVYKTKVFLENPVIVDCYTDEDGYFNWGYLPIIKLNIYPNDAKSMMLRYLDQRIEGHSNDYEMSTDEIAAFSQKAGYDGVLFKNIREGIYGKLPVYDLVLWSMENLLDTENITDKSCNEPDIYTYKRLDLKKYCDNESNEDGILRECKISDELTLIHKIVSLCYGEYTVEYILKIYPQKFKYRIYYRDTSNRRHYLTYDNDEGYFTYAGIIGDKIYPANTEIMLNNLNSSAVAERETFTIEKIY